MNIDVVQKHLRDSSIDLCILACPDSNVNYFVEREMEHGVLAVTHTDARLFVSALDSVEAVDGLEICDYRKDWLSDLSSFFSFDPLTINTIAVNTKTLTVSLYQKIQTTFAHAKIIDISLALSEIRLVKSDIELSKMKQAAAIADKALLSFVETFRREGLTRFLREIDVALFLEGEIRRQGAGLSFPCIAAFGANSAVPHHIPGLTKLGGEDGTESGFLLIDFGAKFEGYCSDMTRMIYLGSLNDFEQEKFDLLLSAQKSCVDLAKEGMRCYDLDAHARKMLGDDEEFFIHSLGHGIGSEVHEAPRLSKRKDSFDVLLAKMPFTIEPGIYYPQQFGLRIEDTCVFIDGKLELLTKSSKELILLDF